MVMSDHVCGNMVTRVFNYLAQLWTIWKESVQEKGTSSTYFSVQSVKITYILFEYHRLIDISIDFYCLILLW